MVSKLSRSIVLAVLLVGCNSGSPAQPDLDFDAGSVDSGSTIEPASCGGDPTLAAIQTGIFTASCAFGSCHSGPTPAANLDLSSGNACGSLVSKPSCDFTSFVRVVPGDPDASYLYHKVLGDNLGTNPNGPCAEMTNGTPQRMPLGGTPLCTGQIEQIKDWIQAGASCDDDAGGDAATRMDGGTDAGTAVDASAEDAGEPTVVQVTATSSLNVGQQVNATVSLSHPAPLSGLSVLISTSNAAVLAAPSAAFVAGGQTTGSFEILGVAPGGAILQATTVGAPASLTIVVQAPPPPVTAVPTLVELFYDDGIYSDGEQWVRLYNGTSSTIDLSQFSIGAGQESYTETTAQLVGTLPPGGCFVVGGPTTDFYNGDPTYSQVNHFLPNFQVGGATGAGVAIFSVPAASLTASTVPVGAVVYGDSNAAGLLAPGGGVATPVPDVQYTGDSLLLQNGSWIDNLFPSPSSCP